MWTAFNLSTYLVKNVVFRKFWRWLSASLNLIVDTLHWWRWICFSYSMLQTMKLCVVQINRAKCARFKEEEATVSAVMSAENNEKNWHVKEQSFRFIWIELWFDRHIDTFSVLTCFLIKDTHKHVQTAEKNVEKIIHNKQTIALRTMEYFLWFLP